MKTKNRLAFLLVAAIAAFSFTACGTGFGPQGALFTQTTIGVYATEVGGARQGEACSFSVLGLVALGNGGVAEAAELGGITRVKSIDLEGFSVLGVFAQLCTVVRGD